MEPSILQYTVEQEVAVITMDNPPVNALGISFLNQFNQILDRLESGHKARAVLLTSACPGFFSAGDDLSSLTDIDDALINTLPMAHEALRRLETLPLPTVAAINGHALGGGLELALVCDFRFMAADSGLIGLPEVKLGLIPALGGTQRLLQVVGKAKAVEMMFKGRQLGPQEAQAIGLINQVWEASSFREQALDFTKRLARQATGAIACIKDCIDVGLQQGIAAGLTREFEMFKKNIRSNDAQEGISAFLSGRKPQFKG